MYRIGIDLGGTNIAAGVVDGNFNIISKASIPTDATRGARFIADDIAGLCFDVTKSAGLDINQIEAVGIASPGICDHDAGVVVYANNLPFHMFPICSLLSEKLPVHEIHVENDANAAAWGEAVAGVAQGTSNSVMITLGTGVGGGIIIDRKVFSGFNYAGAELGHIVISVDGRQCSCGRRGCWEAYSSATALIAMTQEKLDECKATGRDTLMLTMTEERGKVSGRTAFDATRAGDAVAAEVVNTYAHYLASGLATIINIFQPEVLSIGGGISNEGDYLINLIEPLVRAEQYGGGLVSFTKLCIAKLKNDAGIVGAATLGIN